MLSKTAIIIGGGIAGCSTAYALAKRDIQVTLIERQPLLASEASGNPFAVLYPRLTGQNTALEQLNIEGYLHTLRLLTELKFADCSYEQCGVIQLAMQQEQEYKQKILSFTNNKLDTYFNPLFQLLNADKLSEIAGIQLTKSGLYFPLAGGVNLPQLCNAMVQHPNIQVLTNTTALEIIHTPQKTWQLLSNAQMLAEADVIVIANAHDALHLEQSKSIPLTAIRGQITYLQASNESQKLRTILCGEGYISPAINDCHYLGATFTAEDTFSELRNEDHISNLMILNSISSRLYGHLEKNIISGRVAWRSQTPDYLPVAGQLLDVDTLISNTPRYNEKAVNLPWLNGLYINAGHGAKGFLSTPLCAEVIACNITGDPMPVNLRLLNALQPNRFLLRKLGLKQLAQHLMGT